MFVKMKHSKLEYIFLLVTFFSGLAFGQQKEFPPDFTFGVATSSYQIEGAWDEDGKAMSVWDAITHTNPAFIEDESTGDIACDSYNKLDEDIKMLKDLGVGYYRFSLSWPRIMPGGYTSKINERGVSYYNKLIDTLTENNIEPVVTLYHWDMPQIITTLGGLSSNTWIDFYKLYARNVFKTFGPKVKKWITFNEPNIICHYFNSVLGATGDYYPNGVIEYLCSYHLLKAHAEVYHIYDKEFRNKQNGSVGITLNFEWSEPESNKSEDIEAAERRRQFDFGIFANPIINFDYPKVVIDRVFERSNLERFQRSRIIKLSLKEKLKIRGTYDFLGLNHYTTWMIADGHEESVAEYAFYTDTKVKRSQNSSWPSTAVDDNKVVPEGLRSALNWIKNTYGNPDILITECGFSDKDGSLNDTERIEFYRGYLNATLQAIVEDGVNVKAFMAWSLMDNFEWNKGYTVKFGLHHVNFTDPARTRTPKQSADYFKEVISSRQVL